jgi:pimeloyl-ACP methyl ester carboxylesterase
MKGFDHSSGHVLRTNGAAIYHESQGDERDPALVLLHGGLGTIADFNTILAHLEGNFRVIGIDSRGHGRSTLGSGRLTYETLQDDVRRVVGHIGLDRFSILGFSDGGIVAYRLAAMSGLPIDRVVAIGAHWELREDDPTRALFSLVTADRWRQRFPDSYQRYQALNPEPDFDAFVRAVAGMWLDTEASGYPGNAVDRIACDLLVVRGDDDPLLSGESAAELATRVPRARLCGIAAAGHDVPEDQPAALMVAVNAFLKARPDGT